MTIKRVWLAAAVSLIAASAPARAGSSPPSPVVVELFTSQGCSSCPPADAYLGTLAKRPGIIALAFHIAYWNYIGWTDPFSLGLAAERQGDYARRLGLHYVYTPQMVIDGAREGIGSEPAKIEPLLRAAADRHVSAPELSLTRRAGGGLHVHVGAGAGAGTGRATLWLVGFDRVRETKVPRGENAGETLRDYRIVRSFAAVGQWQGAPMELDVAAGAVTGDGAALLLQTDGAGPIIAATLLAGPAS